MNHHWQLRLSQLAERDFFNILHWTTEHFGVRQARAYATILRNALKALALGPESLGCRARSEIGPDILSLHVARNGRNGRHFIVFRVHDDSSVIEVLRILHDSMDVVRHLES